MRWLLLSAFILTAVMGASGQAATGTTQSLPDDPQNLLAAAEPFYDFNAPELKPWHLKATYQLYDDNGKPSEQGTYEYWWASPQVYRSTWTRKGATYSDWHTADGRHLVLAKAKPLGYFEEGLRSDFVSPLPSLSPFKYETAEPQAKTTYQSSVIQAGSLKLPCVAVEDEPSSGPNAKRAIRLPASVSPVFCFDSMLHVLRVEYSYGVVATEFDNVVKMQGKFLAREVQVAEGNRSILNAEVDAVDVLSASDPALVPDHASKPLLDPRPGEPIIPAKLMRAEPAIPVRGMRSGQRAEVVLQITVAKNGTVRDLRVVLAPSDEMAEEATRAVSQWRFIPFQQEGKQVEMRMVLEEVFHVK